MATYKLLRTDSTTCGELELTIKDMDRWWNLPLSLGRSDWIRRAVIRYRGQVPVDVAKIEELATWLRPLGEIGQVEVVP